MFYYVSYKLSEISNNYTDTYANNIFISYLY